jgi:hypothetical protein
VPGHGLEGPQVAGGDGAGAQVSLGMLHGHDFEVRRLMRKRNQ